MQRTIDAAIGRSAVLFLLVVLALAGCSNPFQVGLGTNVDIDRPDGDIDSPGAGQYLAGTVTLNGSYSDDVIDAVPTVSLRIDAAAALAATVDADSKTWSYVLDTTQFPDGEHEVVVTITDASGKSTEKRQLYYIDNTPPLVVVTIPQNYASNSYNGNVTVRGEAADQFGLSSLEYRILDNADAPRTDWEGADGTTSWAFIFDSRDPAILAAQTGALKAEVRATDRAGNVSTSVVHYDDVLDATGEVDVTVEALRQILAGESVPGAPVAKPQLEAILFSQPGAFPIQIDQALDNPTFVVSNPDENSPRDQNVLPGSPLITGTVEDDSEGVDEFSIEYRVLSGDSTVVNWTGVDNTFGTGLLVRWNATIAGLTDGDYELEVRASDTGTASAVSNPVEFRVDSGAPTVEVTDPSQGDYINGPFQLTGTAFDLTSVEDIDVSLNGGLDWYNYLDPEMSGSLSGGPPTYGWDVNVDPTALGLADGPRTIKVAASDGSSAATFNLQVVIDRQTPSASLINPAPSSSVNGEVIIRGTASDNNQVTKVELKIGSNDPYIELPGTYNWEYAIDSTSYASATHATETSPGSNVWRLDVLARVTDIAGNEHVETGYFIYIDNDLDKPTVTFVSPSDGQRIAGPTLVSGTAFDDDAVSAVFMRLDVNNDGDYDDAIDLNGDFDTVDPYEDETQIYTLDGTTLWSYELNSGGELYGASGGTGEVTIGVWAQDINFVEGNRIERTVQFDDTIPRAENLNYASSDYVGGTFTLNADILDDVQVKSVKISYNGGQNYVDLVTSNNVVGGHGADITKNGVNDFDLHIEIDTASVLPGLSSPIDSGILYLRLRIEDEANYQSITYVNLNVDNIYPTGSWDAGSADPQEIEGSQARVQGTATDAGTVSGVGEVHVYFIRGGLVFDLESGATVAPVPTDFDDGNGTVDYAPANTASETYRLEIDDKNEFGSDGGGNGDSDGFDESLTVAGSTYTWWAEFDSNEIPDGKLEVHYVVFDSAGNGTHYLLPDPDGLPLPDPVEGGFVKNNPPSISSLVVGTDINSDTDTLDVDERTTFSSPGAVLTTGMTARNDVLYVQINAAAGGNTPVAYSLQLDGSGPNLIASGNSVSVDTSGYVDGTYSYLAKVVDAVGIETQTSFTIDVDNTDGAPPTVLLDPIDYDSVKTVGSVVYGYAEAQGESDFDGADPDVSGTIVLSGRIADTQIINQVTIAIDGFAGGTPFTVASWDGSQLVSSDGSFAISTQSLSEAAGHEIEWTYEWDSAQIADRAATNVTITVGASDYQGNPGDTTTTIDVVPYITSITNSGVGGVSNDVIRSSTGKYSVDRSSDGANYLVINGFNFDDASLDIRISAAPVTAPAGTSILAQKTGTATSTRIDLGKDFGVSGYLTLFVGPAAVPSINNINDSALPQSLEDDPILPRSARWTDDRYLHVFELTQMLTGVTNSTFYYPSMIMDGNQPVYTYSNDNSGSTQRTTDDATTERRGYLWYERQTAVDRDDDGRYYIASVQDAFSGGSIGYLYVNRDRDRLAAYGGNNRGNHIELVGEDYVSRQLNRFRYPRINVDGPSTGAYVYVAVYDAHPDEKDLKFFAFEMTGSTATNLNEPAGDGDIAGNGWVSLPGTQDATSSQYFDLVVIGDATSAGHKVVVPYYDETAATLKLMYAVEPVDASGLYDGGSTWYTIDVESSGSYAGTFVSATTDGTDVYLAYYDSSNANMKVAYVPGAKLAGAGPGAQPIDTYTIDSYLSVGTWTNITLIGGTPYVSYYSDSYNGTRSPIRLAYPLGPLSDGVISATNSFTGTWEVISVPTVTAPLGGMPQFNRTHIGQYSDGVDLPVVGWLGSKLEYAKLRPTP